MDLPLRLTPEWLAACLTSSRDATWFLWLMVSIQMTSAGALASRFRISAVECGGAAVTSG